jgi:predicted unusual protein kinase regulating ubiquinone biosynthesis (AarF/ABC1/UbiB family)
VFRHRYRRIVFFFARALLSLVFWELLLPVVGLGGASRRSRSRRLRRLAQAFRALALRMGGVLIKVGQFLSSRHDVLPPEITSELAGLQDEVPAERFEDIRKVAEAELQAPLSARFASFDETPLAAASLGQVHRARLPPAVPGASPVPEAVVVKVLRPHIEEIIETDLAALRTVGRWLARYPPIRRRANIPALLDELTRSLHEEVDYAAEGKNAEAFAARFKDRSGIRVPSVVWTHSTRRVLTLEDVFGIKVTDHAALEAAGIDPRAVARRLFDSYLHQIFTDGFFHADPHPGNMFVAKTPTGFELRFVDFGMVGRVTPETRAGLREMAVAIATKDAGGIVRAAKRLGMLLPGADLALLERVEARLLERFWGKSIGELNQVSLNEVREVIGELKELLYTMPFQVPEDLILLGRTTAILSGMCASLDRDFNAWGQFVPFGRRLMAEDAAPLWETFADKIGGLGRALLSVPKQADSVLAKVDRGELVLRVPELVEQVARVELTLRRLTGGIVFAACLVGGIQMGEGHPRVGRMLLGVATLALGYVLLARRSGRSGGL